MQFRTKKNQKSHQYDEYLAYEESKRVESEPLYSEDNQEAYRGDGPLYDPQTYNQADEYHPQYEEGVYPQEEDTYPTDGMISADYDSFEENYEPYPGETADSSTEEEYPSRQAYLQAQKSYEAKEQGIKETYEETSEQTDVRRAKYSAKVDRFLTNGIIVVGVLLIAVLLIAFLV